MLFIINSDNLIVIHMFTVKLKNLHQANLHRVIRDRDSVQGARIYIDGREFINFASNDYLGLANHPALVKAAKEALELFGFGGGASRLLSGGTRLHKTLEQMIAEFKDTEAALIFNSGYAANTGIIPSIADEGDVIFSDELNHASIIDGCRLSKARTEIYRHKDMAHLSELIEKEKKVINNGRFIIVTDSVFSMDGDLAPIQEIYDICSDLNSSLQNPHSTLLYLDDAHGTGVLGNGRGTLAHFNIKAEPWILQMGTFSKALGSYGAFAAGDRDVIEWLTNTSRSLVYSTALPACAVAASLKAMELLQELPDLVKKLWTNRTALVGALEAKGCKIEGETPIIPIKVKNSEIAVKASRYLYENGIYAPAIRPPTVKEPRLRITITAGHSEEDINSLLGVLDKTPGLNLPRLNFTEGKFT